MPGTSGYQQNERSVGLNGLWASSEPDQSSNRGRMVECLERAATKARQSCDNLYIHIPDCLLQLSVQSRFGFDFRTIISDLSKIQVPSDTSICWPCQVKPVEPQTILHLTQVAPGGPPGGPAPLAPASCLCWGPFSNNGWTSFAHRDLYQFVQRQQWQQQSRCNLYALESKKTVENLAKFVPWTSLIFIDLLWLLKFKCCCW